MLIPKKVSAITVGAAKKNQATRYALDGVLLERDEHGVARAVVTNGRMLIVSRFDEPPSTGGVDYASIKGFSIIIDAKDLTDALKTVKKSDCMDVSERSSEGPIEVGNTRATPLETVDGSFPPWRDLIPNYAAGESARIAVNARLLGDAARALRRLVDQDEHDGSPVVTLEVPLDPNRPLVLSANHERHKAVIMPVHGDWSQYPQAQAAEKDNR